MTMKGTYVWDNGWTKVEPDAVRKSMENLASRAWAEGSYDVGRLHSPNRARFESGDYRAPGGLIRSLSPEVRKMLKELKSNDIQNAEFSFPIYPDHFQSDPTNPKISVYKFGPFEE